MSSQRVRYIRQFFPIGSYTYNTTTATYSITANNHLLFEGVPVYLVSEPYNTTHLSTANVTSSNTFNVSCPSDLPKLSHYYVNGYLSNQTGVKPEHTLPRATGTETIVQTYVNGTGGASLSVDVSLDTQHWINVGSIVNGTASGNTGYITISPGWAYMRPNVVSIGANTNLVIMTGE